jgi:hypothetical protein
LHLNNRGHNLTGRDEYDRQSQSTRSTAAPGREDRPRVVIFDGEGEPRVEILELPEAAGPGDLICHWGTQWQVTATRTGDRVLIARPFQA